MLTETLYRQLPHSGAMRLIERIVSWNEHTICCSSDSHRSNTNPLLIDGALPALCVLEYAAQALALHAVLNRAATDGENPVPEARVVGSQRLKYQTIDLAAAVEPLFVRAELTVHNENSALYAIAASIGDECVLQGDLTVMLSAM